MQPRAAIMDILKRRPRAQSTRDVTDALIVSGYQWPGVTHQLPSTSRVHHTLVGMERDGTVERVPQMTPHLWKPRQL